MNIYKVGDNLLSLKETANESVDFIYLDPPYNTGRNFYNFNDKFKSITDFINFIKVRIIECKRVMKKHSNIVIHIEPRISHYFRIICDEVFGVSNFRNEIVWQTGGNAKNLKQLNRYHDTLIVYSKGNQPTFNPMYFPYDAEYKKKSGVQMCDITKREYVTSAAYTAQPDVIPRPNLRYTWRGIEGKQWICSKERMTKLHNENRLQYNSKGIPRIKRFLDEMQGIPLRDIWTDLSNTQRNEKLDYATQKPIKLLERILKLYSNENNVCLDIFAGSGTLGRAAINLNRKFLLFDINEKGKEIFEKSIQND